MLLMGLEKEMTAQERIEYAMQVAKHDYISYSTMKPADKADKNKLAYKADQAKRAYYVNAKALYEATGDEKYNQPIL